MPQPMQISCPHCGRILRVADVAAGKRVLCPQCQGVVRVPSRSEAHTEAETRWLVRTEDGTIYGPVSRGELDEWVQEGRVRASCHISSEHGEEWIWASEMFPQLTSFRPTACEAPAADPRNPYDPRSVSDKSRLVAGLLGLLLPLVGLYGVHRLYTGHILLGILMFITCGGCGIWQLVDVILVFAGSVTDADGRPLRD